MMGECILGTDCPYCKNERLTAENEQMREDIDYNWTNEVNELRHELREERAENERLKTIIRRTHDNLPTSPEIAYQRLRDAIESFADTAQEKGDE